MESKKFYNEDSDAEFLDKLISEGVSFDLILTDPPYNLGKDFGNDSDDLSLDDFLNTNRRRIEKCKDLLKEDGSIVWFAIHHLVGYLQVMMYKTGLEYRRMNIWHYENGFSRTKTAPRTEYEPFLWFSQSDSNWTYNADDVRVPYKSEERLENPVYYTNSDGEKKAWTPNPDGRLRGDVWKFPTLAGKSYEGEKTEHPTQKPEALITELVKAFCPKDDDGNYNGSILDPYAGSGTLGVCCEKLNKNGHDIDWICNEIESKWVEVSEGRVSELRDTLFDE
ncbi:site-specific DNA-methyltransferase (adenine-specific) [Salinibacter ruber]|uniref:DNA-methyltransferase n=1 Tax=Salinibacter ruber TaxID=146919 RepID=UPI002168AFF7|nr:site-specific DNA-methyltransferase [Salinibacter ruber]MCS3755233.1 site-specific DNA-methyltransferase (adenine-specific) [Salinibacter ruber]